MCALVESSEPFLAIAVRERQTPPRASGFDPLPARSMGPSGLCRPAPAAPRSRLGVAFLLTHGKKCQVQGVETVEQLGILLPFVTQRQQELALRQHELAP